MITHEITKIKKVKNLGQKTDYVFDIGMKGGNHTFFANDILVHNSVYASLANIMGQDSLVDKDLEKAIEAINVAGVDINERLKLFSKLILKSEENWLEFKPEKISYTAFHQTKKRYALCVRWAEGYYYTEENTKKEDRIYDEKGKYLGKLDITGLDIVRSDFPERFKKFMTNTVKKILAKFSKEKLDTFIINFQNEIEETTVNDIMFPSGISDIVKYNAGRKPFEILKKTPIHVKSSLFFNDLLKHYKIKNIAPVRNMDKIKWCYLKENPLRLSCLALKNNDKNPQQIINYITKYIDYDKMFKSKLKNKLQMFYDVLDWGSLPNKNTQKINQFFKF